MSFKLPIKQVDLSNAQQDNSQTQFLVIDSEGNVYWSDAISVTGQTYTNAEPVPETIGGIAAGSTFSGVTLQNMWTQLLYPYQAPSFTSFSVTGGSPLEVGQTLATTLSFTWNSDEDANVVPNSIVISDITGDLLTGQASDGVSVPYTYGTAVTRSTTGSYVWTVTGENTNGSNYNRTSTKYWYWRVFHGTSSSTAAPTESFIEALANNPLKSSGSGTYTFAANDYKYLAIPDEYGVPTSITYNGLPFALADSSDGYNDGSGAITYTTVSITNTYGITETYNVFRSKNPIVGVVSMNVSY